MKSTQFDILHVCVAHLSWVTQQQRAPRLHACGPRCNHFAWKGTFWLFSGKGPFPTQFLANFDMTNLGVAKRFLLAVFFKHQTMAETAWNQKETASAHIHRVGSELKVGEVSDFPKLEAYDFQTWFFSKVFWDEFWKPMLPAQRALVPGFSMMWTFWSKPSRAPTWSNSRKNVFFSENGTLFFNEAQLFLAGCEQDRAYSIRKLH